MTAYLLNIKTLEIKVKFIQRAIFKKTEVLMKPIINGINEYLPESMQYLMTVISEDSVFKLINAYGGRHIEVPKRAKLNHRLTELIGLDDMKNLTAVYGSTQLEIPLCSKLQSLSRGITIFQDRNSGTSQSKLARKYHISERQVRRIIERIKAKDTALMQKIQATITSLI